MSANAMIAQHSRSSICDGFAAGLSRFGPAFAVRAVTLQFCSYEDIISRRSSGAVLATIAEPSSPAHARAIGVFYVVGVWLRHLALSLSSDCAPWAPRRGGRNFWRTARGDCVRPAQCTVSYATPRAVALLSLDRHTRIRRSQCVVAFQVLRADRRPRGIDSYLHHCVHLVHRKIPSSVVPDFRCRGSICVDTGRVAHSHLSRRLGRSRGRGSCTADHAWPVGGTGAVLFCVLRPCARDWLPSRCICMGILFTDAIEGFRLGRALCSSVRHRQRGVRSHRENPQYTGSMTRSPPSVSAGCSAPLSSTARISCISSFSSRQACAFLNSAAARVICLLRLSPRSVWAWIIARG